MKLRSPSTARNKSPILDVLGPLLARPSDGRTLSVLEVASGAGEHAMFFAEALPWVTWQPTDPDSSAFESIEAWRMEGPRNVLAPLRFDLLTDAFPEARFDAVVNINMIHISPWAACEALLAGAERSLHQRGLLFLYGPYFREGIETAPSNLAFDEDLRRRNPDWGIRSLERVIAAAASRKLRHVATHEMPANNLSVVFERV
jgi:hypothetical protein